MTANTDLAVVLDTMAMSAIVNESKKPGKSLDVRNAIGDRSVVLSFVTVTELRFGAINAGWGELHNDCSSAASRPSRSSLLMTR